MGHQRAIKKALMRGKGIKTKRVEFLTTGTAGLIYGTRSVSTVGEYKLVTRCTGPKLSARKGRAA